MSARAQTLGDDRRDPRPRQPHDARRGHPRAGRARRRASRRPTPGWRTPSAGCATSGRFADVEVRRRYRSIDNPSDILVMIVVDEHDAVSADDLTPGPVARLRSAGMWLPILSYADGYGLTYGARVSFVEPFGPRSRISVPLTWGGERRAAVELESSSVRQAQSRAASASRSVNGASTRTSTCPTRGARSPRRSKRALTPWLRAGATRPHRARDVRRRATPGTRPPGRSSRSTRASIRRSRGTRCTRRVGLGSHRASTARRHAAATRRHAADVRGYVGIGGSAVLALRAAVARAGAPLPPSEQLLLGGGDTLRGYRAGHRAGDSLALRLRGSALPLTSPLQLRALRREGIRRCRHDVGRGHAPRRSTFRSRDRRRRVTSAPTAVTANVDVGVARDRQAARPRRRWA